MRCLIAILNLCNMIYRILILEVMPFIPTSDIKNQSSFAVPVQNKGLIWVICSYAAKILNC